MGPWTDNWEILPGDPELEDPAPDPAESFQAMEEEVTSGGRGSSLTDPVLPCRQPYLELTLLTENNEPAAFAGYKLTGPGGGRSGKLDEFGHIRIDGLDVPADQVMLKVRILDKDENSDEDPTYELQLVPIEKDDVLKEETEDEPAAEPEYFHPTFDGRLFVLRDDEEDEDEDYADEESGEVADDED